MSTTTRITDWVSFTLNHYTDVGEVLEQLGLEFLACDRGMHGYRSQVAADGGSIRVMYDGSAAMGIHVQISGAGCRLLEALGKVGSWSDYLRSWLDRGARFTRLDLAIDCHDPAVTIDRVRSHISDRSLTSRWKQVEMRETVDLGTGDGKGAGIYFGSGTSEVRLRIYDKLLEQASKGNDLGGVEAWTRFEYQARNDRAQLLAEMIADGREDDAYGVLRSYLEFRDYRLDSNPSMAPVASWWADLLGVGKLVVRIGELATQAVDKLHKWFERQIAPALAVLVERERDQGGDFESAILSYVTQGRGRWRERHRLMAGASFA